MLHQEFDQGGVAVVSGEHELWGRQFNCVNQNIFLLNEGGRYKTVTLLIRHISRQSRWQRLLENVHLPRSSGVVHFGGEGDGLGWELLFWWLHGA